MSERKHDDSEVRMRASSPKAGRRRRQRSADQDRDRGAQGPPAGRPRKGGYGRRRTTVGSPGIVKSVALTELSTRHPHQGATS